MPGRVHDVAEKDTGPAIQDLLHLFHGEGHAYNADKSEVVEERVARLGLRACRFLLVLKWLFQSAKELNAEG